MTLPILRRGRGSLAKLADDLGITRGAVVKWHQIPASRVIKVAALTGLSRHDLRPDLYPEPFDTDADLSGNSCNATERGDS